MEIKLNWGKKLVIAMTLFIVFIVGMAIVMMNSSEALYEDDYYEVGENHAARMEAEQASENVEIDIAVGTNKLNAKFNGTGKIKKIKLIYLANAHYDRTINVHKPKASAVQSIPLGTLKPGLWSIEVTGVVNDEEFFSKIKLRQ